MHSEPYVIEKCDVGWAILSNGRAIMVCQRKRSAIDAVKRAAILLHVSECSTERAKEGIADGLPTEDEAPV